MTDPLREAFGSALAARYPRLSDREDMDLEEHADWVAKWLFRARAEECWRIGNAISTQVALATDRLAAGSGSYTEGQRDAYEHAERIVSGGD